MTENIVDKQLSEWGLAIKNTFYIAGPCSAESEEQLMQTALALKDYEVNVMRAGIWKPRTRPGSFEGVGEAGLRWLKNAGQAANLPVTTEVATAKHVEECLKHGIDILWIGARTTSNPFAVQDIADALQGTNVPVLVKNPINPDIELWHGAVERLAQAGIKKLGVIHRGFSTYEKTAFRNQPIWRIPIEMKRRNPQLPMLCDPSHICGNTELLFTVAQNALDLLFDGLMIEVHINPPAALSDPQQQLTPVEYGHLLSRLKIKKESSESLDFQDNINTLRQEIDKIDRQILELLAMRMDNARKIAFHKMKNNIAILQPNRWEEIIQSRVKEGVEKKLAADFITRLYQFIHEESIRQQEQVVSD
ncbi:MAG: bifunctional 3-deoxy-7-phosphoheptulonate synthase/chorismate mutase type II [Acidobacteria bacterium]|jgi:chorismate mutase|nr:bifunctional 3-deoxy-7-phosphoheptulonate synthase/chorismate mutase type II [Acidobacteriota bacterium]